MVRIILRYALVPLVLIGGIALGTAMVGADVPVWQRLAVLSLTIGLMLWAERILPFESHWNRDHHDTWRDVLHGSINTALHYFGVWLLPLFASLGVFAGHWPSDWPFWLQTVMAILVLDAGVSLTHYASHKIEFLWRFHAVHHSVTRLYGFNGLMKHPVHQTIETIGGITPLLLFGIPSPVAAAVVFAVAIQLLLQHANVDFKTGPFKYVLATAEVHRFHHRKEAGQGDVNFGLFTTFWDHLLGTCYYEAEQVRADALGIGDQPNYPSDYISQLTEPFRHRSSIEQAPTKEIP